jgi:hypothetical protein
MDLFPARRSSSLDLISRSQLAPYGAQVAQDVALAALLGGNLFGRLAMHPALADVSDKAERGKVLNHAWRRYGNINSAALLVLVGGWALTRGDASTPWSSSTQRGPVLAKDVAVGTVAVTGLASALGGVGFAQQAPEGAVPLQSGSRPAPETPGRAARLKRLANVLGGLNLAAEVALLAVNAAVSRRAGRLSRH